MEMVEPKLAKGLLYIEDSATITLRYLEEETPLIAVRCDRVRADGDDLSDLDLRASTIENSAFRSCSFENASLTDVVLQSRDFSDSDFSGTFLERCQWNDCKCVGVSWNDSVLRQTIFEQTLLSYPSFDQTRTMDVWSHRVGSTEGSLSEAKLKNFSITESRLTKNNFFQTLLAGVNLTTDKLVGSIVSSTAEELGGVMITPFQTADLVGLWGIPVDRG